MCLVSLLLLHHYSYLTFHSVYSSPIAVAELGQWESSGQDNSRLEYLLSQTLGRKCMCHSLPLLPTKILAAIAPEFAIR
jgi:hypothetical protein